MTLRLFAAIAVQLVAIHSPAQPPKPSDNPTCAVLTLDARAGVSGPESEMLRDHFAGEFDRLGRHLTPKDDILWELDDIVEV